LLLCVCIFTVAVDITKMISDQGTSHGWFTALYLFLGQVYRSVLPPCDSGRASLHPPPEDACDDSSAAVMTWQHVNHIGWFMRQKWMYHATKHMHLQTIFNGSIIARRRQSKQTPVSNISIIINETKLNKTFLGGTRQIGETHEF